MIKQLKIFLLMIMISFLSATSMAWDNEITHKDLSLQSAEVSKVVGNSVLNSLGLRGALKQSLKLNGKIKQVVEWIQEVADLEDA